MKTVKVILIVMAIISGVILAILFLQDRTRKLEDRKYKEISKISIDSDTANVNLYKSNDENVRVVVYGTKKDTVQLIEGTKTLDISKITGNKTCILNCKNQIDLYIPETVEQISVKSDVGNIDSEVDLKSISINSNVGNININKVNVLNITTNTGNVNIKEINATNNSSIKTEVGNVKIDTIINLKISAISNEGSVVIPVIKEEQEFTLKIESNIGNVDINHHENKSE